MLNYHYCQEHTQIKIFHTNLTIVTGSLVELYVMYCAARVKVVVFSVLLCHSSFVTIRAM